MIILAYLAALASSKEHLWELNDNEKFICFWLPILGPKPKVLKNGIELKKRYEDYA